MAQNALNQSAMSFLKALEDCIECLMRLPDAEGAFRVTYISQAKSAIAKYEALCQIEQDHEADTC